MLHGGGRREREKRKDRLSNPAAPTVFSPVFFPSTCLSARGACSFLPVHCEIYLILIFPPRSLTPSH